MARATRWVTGGLVRPPPRRSSGTPASAARRAQTSSIAREESTPITRIPSAAIGTHRRPDCGRRDPRDRGRLLPRDARGLRPPRRTGGGPARPAGRGSNEAPRHPARGPRHLALSPPPAPGHRAALAGVQLDLRVGDLRTPPVTERVPLAICPFRSLLHMHTDEDRLAVLGSAHDLLVPDGRFVFDVFAPNAADIAQTHDRWLE